MSRASSSDRSLEKNPLAAAAVDGALPATGPLQVSKENPRYFADPSGKAVFLTGSHTWDSLRDLGPTDPPKPFDWPGYLDFLIRRHHNFIRLWVWDLFQYVAMEDGKTLYVSPFPWPRSGPAKALDGKPQFDLAHLDQSYFDRLRERVQGAGQRGLYVSIMLFDGWGVQFAPEGWAGHPFNAANNSSGINGDPDRTGKGLAVCTLHVPAVTRLQEAYVRKVIDTVNDLDNVLYEVCNEAHPDSAEWQYHLTRFIKQYEAGKPKQHLVGMTTHISGLTTKQLFASPADWISPGQNPDEGEDYCSDPPLADGSKVILSDTDHLWGIGGGSAWVWKTCCRGMHPIFMDPYYTGYSPTQPTPELDPRWDPARDNMGYARRFTERMELAKAVPSEAITSSRYCLAVPGKQYLVYLPDGGAVTVDLSAASGKMAVEWFDPSHGTTQQAEAVTAGEQLTLRAPFVGEAVLYLYHNPA